MWSCDGHRARLLPRALAVAIICCMAAAPCSAQGTASDAGGGMPSCVSKLAPCGGYLNATDTTPVPDSCCDPLKEAATTEAACVCSILMNKAALQAFGVAPEQGLLLANRCGITTDASTCAKYAGAAASTASTGTAASTVAKPTASGGTTHQLSLMAAPSLVVSFSFIWWSIVA
ncbi:unnamed protein product [Alopecurus aequalis]